MSVKVCHHVKRSSRTKPCDWKIFSTSISNKNRHCSTAWCGLPDDSITRLEWSFVVEKGITDRVYPVHWPQPRSSTRGTRAFRRVFVSHEGAPFFQKFLAQPCADWSQFFKFRHCLSLPLGHCLINVHVERARKWRNIKTTWGLRDTSVSARFRPVDTELIAVTYYRKGSSYLRMRVMAIMRAY